MPPTDKPPVAVAVFAKAPIPGLAKTRLIPRLGEEGAASLQSRLLRQTLTTVAAARLGPVSLWCAPSREHPSFLACREEFGLSLFDQQGRDLGERMLGAFTTLCPETPVLLVGTDCPALTVAALAEAARSLREGDDAVFLTAEDGGYVLIGLRQAHPSLFRDMAWGTGRVMADTRERLSRLGWRWTEPLRLWDIDRPEDIDRLRASGLFDDWFREMGAYGAV